MFPSYLDHLAKVTLAARQIGDYEPLWIVRQEGRWDIPYDVTNLFIREIFDCREGLIKGRSVEGDPETTPFVTEPIAARRRVVIAIPNMRHGVRIVAGSDGWMSRS